MLSAIQTMDLHYTYPDGTPALNGFSCQIQKGECVGIVGPSGAGKSTLALCLSGLVLPQKGTILIGDQKLDRKNLKQLRSKVGLIFQNPDDQLFMPTLLEDAAFGPLNQGFAPAEAEARARAAIEAVGLSGFERRSAYHASEGQKRNASLATILSMNVKLLLLDEPGAGLDFRSRRRLTEILAGRGESMLMATHDMDMVRALCRQVILLDAGRVAAVGSVTEILDDAELLALHGLA